MDPMKAFDEIMAKIREIDQLISQGKDTAAFELAGEAVELAKALSDWVRHGGFEPYTTISAQSLLADAVGVKRVCRILRKRDQTLARVREILWPAANPEQEWEADTIEIVAEALQQ